MKRNNKRVCVLVSTYNGSAFIEAQLDSILSQTYENIDIFIRDDGSRDDTLSILEKYETRQNVKVFHGENKGFIKSFFELLQLAPGYDYYSFCDQDDIWLENKVERAVEALSKMDETKPNLYFSSYEICDEFLNLIGKSRDFEKPFTFQNALVDCTPLGFASVINKTTRNLMCERTIEHCCGHDWYAYLLCTGLGNVYFDKTVTAKYRRHSNNVSSGGASFIKFQIWRFKKFFLGNYFLNLRNQLVEFEQIFGDKLTEEKQNLLSKFTLTKYSLIKQLSKSCSLNYYRHSLTDEIFVRLLMLIGKL